MKCREEIGSEVNKPTACRSASVVDHKVGKGTDGERLSLPLSLRCDFQKP